MFFPFSKRLRRVRRTKVNDIHRDADELLQLWGSAAYDVATNLSWKEDAGWIASPAPGHWWQVRRELGCRLGQSDREFRPD